MKVLELGTTARAKKTSNFGLKIFEPKWLIHVIVYANELKTQTKRQFRILNPLKIGNVSSNPKTDKTKRTLVIQTQET